jgi:L-ascorbate metabolism protein UlaG (beta-lactamase superfamily)
MNTPKQIRPAAWWTLGTAAAALVLACSSPGTDNSSSSGSGDTEEGGDWFAETYPVFEVAEHTGDGDGVIELPDGVSAAMVTATHDGDANFSVSALDDGNQPTGDLLVNTIGDYTGTTALGMHDLGNPATTLQVTAAGAWTITLAPLADAPALAESGEGDGVFRYEGGAATWNVTHDGDANFVVSYYTGADFEMSLLINEIGAYEGSIAATEGPGLVVINADGAWTLTAA